MTEDRYERGLDVLTQLDPHGPEQLEQLRAIAPRLPRDLVEFVYGTVYSSGEVSLRDREIVAIGALAAQGGLGLQLKTHIGYALRLGVAKEEIVGLLTCVGIHAGFPAALNGLLAAHEAFTQADGGAAAHDQTEA